MTLPYLQTFSRDFSPAQRRALEDLAARASQDNSLGEDEIQALFAKIERGVKPLFEKPEFGAEILDSCKISTALESLRADLTTLLNQAQVVETTSVRHDQLHRSLVRKLHQAILRLDELILTNKTRRLNPEYTDVKFVDFYTARNEASTPNRAVVENDTGQLVGSPSEFVEMMSRAGPLKPKLSSTIISTGVNPDANRSLLPEDAGRKSPNYVWGEVILADSPISGSYDSVDYEGALVRLDVDLPQAEDVNEIKLGPWGRYPLNVVAIEYFDGDIPTAIPGLTLPMTLELDVTAIRFEPVNTRKIRVVFHQPAFHYAQHAFEKGQIKRSSLLNVMLERVVEDTINDQGTLPYELQDRRRTLAKDALDSQLGLLTETNPADRYRQAIDKITAVDSRELMLVTKYQYVVGLRTLEISYKRYRPVSEYVGAPLQATGSVFEFTLNAEEQHVEQSDGGVDFNATSVEWSVDMGDGRIVDILPEGSDLITEVLDFDATLVTDSRFIEDTASPSREVFRDGELLTLTTDYTLSAPSAGQPVTVTITPAAWRPGSIYLLVYRPISTESVFSVLDNYQSIKPIVPEVFTGTGENNRISLKAHPFVLPEVAAENVRWSKPDPFDAGWAYRGINLRTAQDDAPYIVLIDGEWYGYTPRTIEVRVGSPVLAADTTIDLTDNRATSDMRLGMPVSGIVRMEDELIYYTGITGYSPNVADFDLIGCIRGYNNTVAADHAVGVTAEWYTSPVYYPVYVEIDGNAARNITNYKTGVHPAFSDTSGPPQFVQIGNSLYFDRPIKGRIEVWYRRLVDHIIVRGRLRSHLPGQEFTPVVNRYHLKMKTATL